MIQSRLDTKDLIADYKRKARQFPRAMNATINDCAAQTKTLISKEIRSEYNIKAGDLNKNFKIKKSTYKTLEAKIEGIGRGISIRKFGATSSLKKYPASQYFEGGYKRYSITAKIKKTGSKKLITGAFGLRGKLKTIMKNENGKLKKVFGPGVAMMFNKNMMNKADIFIRKKFPVVLERHIKFFGE